MNKMDGMSMDLTGENIAQLKKLFPEAVTEGKIDFEVLKALLGGEIEQRQEYYKFTWNGKEAARAYARTRSMGTLRPCVEESSGKDGTPGKFDSENLYIEGDNLEVLKLLQGAYYKKVKMIYIDPPYNTGKDFVYPDNYRDSIKNYKELTGQTDAEGKSTRANPETSGRYHTDWLNMMYPRLILARNLLTDDGVIFISIDDNEVDNLKKLCNEVFGEENFISEIVVKNNPRGRQSDTNLATVHEYLLCYARNVSNCKLNGEVLNDNQKAEFVFQDNIGQYRLLGLRQRGVASLREDRPDMFFPIYVNPENQEISLTPENGWQMVLPRKSDGRDGRWMWGLKKCHMESNRLVAQLIKRRNEYDIFVKDYLIQDGKIRTRKFQTIWDSKDINNQVGTQEVKGLLEGDFMSFPKSRPYIEKICQVGSCQPSIILDFFSGSATTAHAVMKLNAEDGGNRKFIMVQLPEPCEEGTEAAKAGYKNICEIGKERIRRAARKVVSDKWEVISVEEKARYGCKELSRADCLAKINGSGENDLFAGEKVTEGGTLCAVGSNAAGSGINSIQHSGRTGEELNEGISPISGNRTGQQGGAGNATASLRSSELPCPYGHFGSDATTSGSRENASCPYKNTAHCPLITKYCSDMGFKVFKLDTSNLLPWNPSAETLEQDLYKAVDNVLADRSTDDLLYEILLKCNLPLTLPIEKKQFGKNTVYIVGMGALAICLDKTIPATIAEEIVKLRDAYAPIMPMQVVFRDTGFDDVGKANALQILKQAGFEEKSIQTI